MASAITSALSRLGEMAVAEAALLRGVDDYIPQLRDKLEWMQTFIQQESGGEGRGGGCGNAYVALWVRQTVALACEVVDVLDEFAAKVDLHDKRAWERWIGYIGGCATHVSVRHGLRGRMDSIKNRLQEISDNANTYKVNKLRSNDASSSTNPTISPFAEWNEKTKVVGSVHERKDLEGRLLGNDTSRSVIAVVGESGVAKLHLYGKSVTVISSG